MHPAYSVIFFTTASGAGFGLLTLLGILGPLQQLPNDRWFGLVALFVAFALAVSATRPNQRSFGSCCRGPRMPRRVSRPKPAPDAV
ncbi:MAG: hypothetical protein RLT05_19370, partial [Bauldia litoralis]